VNTKELKKQLRAAKSLEKRMTKRQHVCWKRQQKAETLVATWRYETNHAHTEAVNAGRKAKALESQLLALASQKKTRKR
jgi:hypothetical protein